METENERRAVEGYVETSTAFLLSQVGAMASMTFMDRIAALGLAPQHAGILRILRMCPGLSQRALAERLGMLPSRLVAVMDELEEKGLVERRQDPEDRRTHALFMTDAGTQVSQAISEIGQAHEVAFCAGLSADEKAQLTKLLSKIAEHQGLTPGVHPGFRHMDKIRADCGPPK